MLGRSIGEQIKAGADPFVGIRSPGRAPVVTAVNLECVVSEKGDAAPRTRFPLRAPAEAANMLARAGVDVVGTANNHTTDFGREALADSNERLRTSGLVVADQSDAPDANHIAFIASNDVASAGSDTNAADRSILASRILDARARSEFVVALVPGAKRTARS